MCCNLPVAPAAFDAQPSHLRQAIINPHSACACLILTLRIRPLPNGNFGAAGRREFSVLS